MPFPTAKMDEQLAHCCQEVGIPPKSRDKLLAMGVRTIDNLLTFEKDLQSDLFSSLRKEVIDKLAIIAQWARQHPNANIIHEFDEDVYDNIKEGKDWSQVYIDCALGRPYWKGNERLYQDVNSNSTLLDEIIRCGIRKVMEPSNLREQCGKFNYNLFLEKAIRHFHSLVKCSNIEDMDKTFVASGRTQAGKSAVKGVIQSLCGLLKIPLIVLTKGVDESIDLHAKLVKLARGTLVKEKHIVVATSKHEMQKSHQLKEARINEALEGGTHGGTLLIADTEGQVLRKACKALNEYRRKTPGGKFILVIDEADAMFRTVDKKQAFEQALLDLLGLKPSMTVLISATPISFMFDLVVELGSDADAIEQFDLEPPDEYVGFHDMRPLLVDGQDMYLEQNEINGKSDYESIPWANEKAIAFYDDAIKCNGRCKGILVLDCSCPWVNVPNNVMDKAIAVQDFYKSKGTQLIVITFTGSGKAVKFPNHEWEKERWKNSRIGNILEYIDSRWGLDMPVFIFGYSKMNRGVSFRSDRRVPTHMLMSLGRGHNCSTVVQTLGRATFNGKSLLNRNGFEHVTILLTQSDFELCKRKQQFVSTFNHRIRDGESFSKALLGADRKIPHDSNFIRSSPREIGKIKGQRRTIQGMIEFEDPPQELSASEEATKERFWEDESIQQLLRSLTRLCKKHAFRSGHLSVHIDDVVDDLEDAEGETVSKTKLKNLFRVLIDKVLVDKEEEAGVYSVFHPTRLVAFLNPEMGEIPFVGESLAQLIGADDESSNASQSFQSQRDVLFPDSESEDVQSGTPGCDTPPPSTPTRQASVASAGYDIILDTGDIRSFSSRSKISSNVGDGRAVTPEKDITSDDGSGLRYVGKNVAKIFDGELHCGTVASYDNESEFWRIEYIDGDAEDFDLEELEVALHLYATREKSKSKKKRGRKRKRGCKRDLSQILEVKDPDAGKSEVSQHSSKKKNSNSAAKNKPSGCGINPINASKSFLEHDIIDLCDCGTDDEPAGHPVASVLKTETASKIQSDDSSII